MKKAIVLVCFVFAYSAALSNIYQACSTCGASDIYGTSSKCVDASLLVKPSNSYYSYPYNSTATFYFNLCSGIDICNGGMACIIGDGSPDIWVYPDDEPNYYSAYYMNTEIQGEVINMYWHIYEPRYRYVSYQIVCNESTPFTITKSYFDSENAEFSIGTSKVCNQTNISTYIPPTNFANLSGNIFLAGLIPMFAMDKASDETSNFDGKFFYSQQYNSMKINGTLTSNSGESSTVAFLFQGSPGGVNPPIMLSYATLPGQTSPECVILPNTSYEEDAEVDLFSDEKNPFYLGSRSYTSIYFQKGSVFPAAVYSNSVGNNPYTTLMTRQSDGMPYFIGGDLLAPFMPSWEFPTYISEFDVNSMSTETLPQSTFAIPPVWECQR